VKKASLVIDFAGTSGPDVSARSTPSWHKTWREQVSAAIDAYLARGELSRLKVLELYARVQPKKKSLMAFVEVDVRSMPYWQPRGLNIKIKNFRTKNNKLSEGSPVG
jgi:hypothetical protein